MQHPTLDDLSTGRARCYSTGAMHALMPRATPRHPADLPQRESAELRLIVRDHVVTTLIGIYDFEHEVPQRLRLNLELLLPPAHHRPWTHGELLAMATDLVTAGHTGLLECLAERLAGAILDNGRARLALIRLEKLDAFAECEAVGVEIVRAAA